MERLMQYIWQHRLWIQHNLSTVDGRRVRILDPGRLNTDSGPDFFNAKIAIDGHTWAGDVEIHVSASDWHRHGHDGDRAYDSVILHVVDRDDTIIHRSNGELIPQMRMPCQPQFREHYNMLVSRSDIDLPCATELRSLPALHSGAWLDSLAFERLYDKAERIESILRRTNGDWESAAFVTIARSLGFGTNGDPFERLAMSLPLVLIGKHSDSLTSIEALLFGQSGLLDDPRAFGPYADRLRQEYRYLAHKFGLKRPEGMIWKMSRMRPAGFPHRRIATLAAMLFGGFRMLAAILETESLDDAVRLFSPDLSPFWNCHYNFGAEQQGAVSAFSRASVAGLVINSVIPLQMAYGLTHDDNSLCDRAVELLHTLAPEKNSIVTLFERAGIKARDAFMTQALIQLRRNYCEPHKCLYCRIGHRMLAALSRRED